MKAISLHQPWASLIMMGVKKFETRHWAPPRDLIGKTIAIHAAKKRVPTILEHAEDFQRAFGADAPGWSQRLPYGALLCTATLAGAYQVAPLDSSRVRIIYSLPGSADPNRFIAIDPYGDFSSGRWIWALTDVETLIKPIPVTGRQGFFNWGNDNVDVTQPARRLSPA